MLLPNVCRYLRPVYFTSLGPPPVIACPVMPSAQTWSLLVQPLVVLAKLLGDEIKARSRRNVVEARSFREMLEWAIVAYQNRSLETAQIIEQLVELAKEMREAHRRGEGLGLSDDELAFYDALEVNDSAVKVLGDATLRTIARELVQTVKRNVTIDWTVRESVRAKLRTVVKWLLRKYGYPPDKEEKATQTVIEQAEVLSREWAA